MYTLTFLLFLVISAAAQCSTNTFYLASNCMDCKVPATGNVIIPASPERAIDTLPSPQYVVTLYARGITGKMNGGTTSLALELDGNAVGMAFQARVSYDYEGDGKYDNSAITPLMATDDRVGLYEWFRPSLGAVSKDMKNGVVRIELWSSFPVASTGKLKIGSGSSTMNIPYSSLSSPACGTSSPSTTARSTTSSTTRSTTSSTTRSTTSSTTVTPRATTAVTPADPLTTTTSPARAPTTSSTTATPSTTRYSDPVVNPAPAPQPAPSVDYNARWSSLYSSKVEDVNIPSGQRLLLDILRVQADVITIEKGGALILSPEVPSFEITVAAIVVKGEFWIGTEKQPFTSPVNIVISGNTDINLDGMVCGTKVIAVANGGVLEWYGMKGSDKSWTYLSRTALRGENRLNFADSYVNPSDVRSWREGDDIVVAGTDYSPDQAEKVTITKVIDANTVEISPALSFYHHGTISKGVDERAEVGLLSRTITVRSGPVGRLGAHTMFLKGSTVHIEGVAAVGMGQDQLARYPFHWHVSGDCAGSYVKHSSVLDSIFRCVTVHGAHNVLVQDVVTMNNIGHCMYLEDGVEVGNVFRHNLVTNVKEKTSGERMGSDAGMAVSGFWMTNPDNVWEDNVVSGSPGAGYWVHVRMGARGYSSMDNQYRDYRPNLVNIRSFNRNKGVGCDHGFQIEATYYDNWNVPYNLLPESPMGAYAPQKNGKDDPIYLDNFTAHHNRFRGLWARAPIVHVRYGKFSNNMEGIQIATSGDHPSPGSVGYITDCLIVGWSDNIGNNIFNNWQMWNADRQRSWPRNGIPMVGVAYYDGPQVIKGCTFDSWLVDVNETPHSAVGTRFHGEFQVASTNSLADCTFKNVTHKSYVSDRNGDGGKAFNFRIPNTNMGLPKGTVLTKWAFYEANNCMSDASVGLLCPQKYSQMWVIDFENRGGNHMVITRNEHTGSNHRDYELLYRGFHSAGIWRYQPLVSIGAHYLVQFRSSVSRSLVFQLNNAEAGETISLSVCYPKGTTIRSVKRGYSNKIGGGLLPPISDSSNVQISAQSSRASVENGEGYFYDNSRGILTVAIKQRLSRSNYANFCPDGGCDFVHIDAAVPDGAVPTDCTDEAYAGDSLQITSGSWLNTKF